MAIDDAGGVNGGRENIGGRDPEEGGVCGTAVGGVAGFSS
jgi:hypothetical protein